MATTAQQEPAAERDRRSALPVAAKEGDHSATRAGGESERKRGIPPVAAYSK
jgi:hypothetical protein